MLICNSSVSRELHDKIQKKRPACFFINKGLHHACDDERYTRRANSQLSLMITTSSQSRDSQFLRLVLEVLGMQQPDRSLPLPVDLIVNGHLAVQVHRHRQHWIISGLIASEISNCDGAALFHFMSQISSVWGDLVSIVSYEKDRDTLILWRELPYLIHRENLESDISLFLKDLEFWRAEAAEAGCVGRDRFL